MILAVIVLRAYSVIPLWASSIDIFEWMSIKNESGVKQGKTSLRREPHGFITFAFVTRRGASLVPNMES